jgi:hypothetical protein
MDTSIRMSQKEVSKYDIIQKTIQKKLKDTEASSILNLTPRHIRRIKERVKKEGMKGLVHKNRGRSSNRKISEKEEEKIKKILKEKYPDFTPAFAREKLEEKHHIRHDRKTVKCLMVEEGLVKQKKKKQEKHRAWRQRRSSYGELLQYDGSYEDWFEGRAGEGAKQCLLAAIDDATGKITKAKFDEHEGVFPTFRFWEEYLKKHGKPFNIYSDKFSTYSMNHKMAQENPDTKTQFKRVTEELGIELILANSPQAKGRVERLFRTLQDRLVKEMRLNHINTVPEANLFLQNVFIPDFNKRFSVLPRSKANLHKKVTDKERNSFPSVFSRHEKRTVRNDYTISYKNIWYQIEATKSVLIQKKNTVIVEEKEDTNIQIKLRGKYLDFHELPERPKKELEKKSPWVLVKSLPTVPAKNHPWRKFQINSETQKTRIRLKS